MAKDLRRFGYLVRRNAHLYRINKGCHYNDGNLEVVYRNTTLGMLESALSFHTPEYVAKAVMHGLYTYLWLPEVLTDLRAILDIPHFLWSEISDDEVDAFKVELETLVNFKEFEYRTLELEGKLIDAA